MHLAFDELGHILWGVEKPTIAMTENRELTRFFQVKHFPSKLWNFCDQTLQFNFLWAHAPDTQNHAADYLSFLETHPQHRVQLKLSDSIPVYRIDIGFAARTPKQDDDKIDWEPELETNQPTPEDQHNLDAVFQMLTRNHDERDEQFAQRQRQLTEQLNCKSTPEWYHHFFKFQPDNSVQYPVMSHVSL